MEQSIIIYQDPDFQDPEVAEAKERPELKHKVLGIPYAEKTEYEILDLYFPDTGQGPFPVIVDVHGGGWFYGSRSSERMEPVLDGLKRGYAVASVDYTLSSYGQFPLQVYELKAAIRFLRANAEKYNLDADKIVLWGLSAGAHLSMIASQSGDEELLDLSMGNAGFSSKAAAAVTLYGPVDLTSGDITSGDSAEAKLLGGAVCDKMDLAEKADPRSYIKRDGPPLFLQYGNADGIVPLAHAYAIQKSLIDAGRKQDFFEIIDGAKHADSKFRTRENTDKIFEFIQAQLKIKNERKGE